MKVRVILMLAAVIAAGPAMAQSVVTRGVGLAHDCYIYAKIGRDARDGIETCNRSLMEEALSRKDKAATYDNRGVMQDMLGHTEAAEADFNMAITLWPDLGDAYVNLGSMLIRKRQLPEAVDQINKGLELGTAFPHIGYYDRALAEELSGRFLEAYHDYQKVLELEPHYAAAEERLKDFTVIRKPAAPGPG
jgi:tetratricopeptide (TPR) repeat protein